MNNIFPISGVETCSAAEPRMRSVKLRERRHAQATSRPAPACHYLWPSASRSSARPDGEFTLSARRNEQPQSSMGRCVMLLFCSQVNNPAALNTLPAVTMLSKSRCSGVWVAMGAQGTHRRDPARRNAKNGVLAAAGNSPLPCLLCAGCEDPGGPAIRERAGNCF